MCFLRKSFAFFTCCVLATFCGSESYETYVLEKLCGSGSLNIELTNSGIPSSGILKATEKSSYSLQMTCNVTIFAPLDHYIMISVRQIDLRKLGEKKCIDYLEINTDKICNKPYEEEEKLHYESEDSHVSLLYHTSPDGLDKSTSSGFTLIFTAFQKASDNQCDISGNSSEKFSCENKNCIWSGLTCDTHNNCGDLSDEDPYGNSNCGRQEKGSTVLIVLGVLILFVLLIMCVATLLCTRNESVRRFSNRLRSGTISFIPTIR